MKTIITTIALVAVSATASMAGDFNLTSWGDRNGKLWSFTKDNGSVWNFYGTGYVNDLKAEITAKNTTISQLEALAIDNADTISALRAQVSDLEAQLAVAMAAPTSAPTIGDLAPESAEVSALMDTVAGSTAGQYLTPAAIDTFIHNGVLPNGGDINAVIEFDPEGGAALQELRDIRVAQVEAGMAHEAYEIHDYNRSTRVEGHTTVIDSTGGEQNRSFVTISINGKSFSSANVTEDGATLGTTFGAGESAADWVQGFEDGYNAGYEDGYADGFADGYAAGVSDSQ